MPLSFLAPWSSLHKYRVKMNASPGINIKEVHMLKIILCCLVSIFAFTAIGCAKTSKADHEMRNRRYAHITELDQRGLQDDLDAILLRDRTSMLTEWVVPYE